MVLAMGLGTVIPDALLNLPSNSQCPNPTDLDVNNNYTVICSGPFDILTNPAAGVLITNVQPLNQFVVTSIFVELK